MTCPLGIKCPCFCCLETDCEHYKAEMPGSIKKLWEQADSFGDELMKIVKEEEPHEQARHT